VFHTFTVQMRAGLQDTVGTSAVTKPKERGQVLKTILVPLDGSKRAEKILPYVEELAFLREAHVILLQVIEPASFMVDLYDTGPRFDQELADSACSKVSAYLEAIANDLRAEGLDVRTIVKFGLVVSTILEVAENEHADLVALASHGRTGLARAFYGSVAAGVLHQADRPLLLIRSDEREQAT
jgi:nucleotide-binding universal stress UspA family protein